MRYQKFRHLHKLNEFEVVPALERASLFAAENNSERTKLLLYKEIDKISHCGDVINTVRCVDCGTNHFKSFNRCKSKFCNLCQRVKSSLWVACLYSWLKQWLEQGNYVVFLNLTIKDTVSLNDGLNQIEGAWRMMSGTKYRKAFLSYFPGGFKSLEVKTGEDSKEWHPHIHALVLKTKYSKDTGFLHYVWPKCVAACGWYGENLKIMSFKKKRGEPSEDYDKRLLKNVREVCKYITKFDWLTEEPSRVGELVNSLYGKRQFAVWGQLINVRKEVEAAFNNKSDKEIQDFICQKCGGRNGVFNKLYKEIWNGENEPLLEDFKTSMPECVTSGAELTALKVANSTNYSNRKKSGPIYKQEHLDFSKKPDPGGVGPPGAS